jgi:hypothetical protein
VFLADPQTTSELPANVVLLYWKSSMNVLGRKFSFAFSSGYFFKWKCILLEICQIGDQLRISFQPETGRGESLVSIYAEVALRFSQTNMHANTCWLWRCGTPFGALDSMAGIDPPLTAGRRSSLDRFSNTAN